MSNPTDQWFATVFHPIRVLRTAALECVGIYYYTFPTLKSARRMWDGMVMIDDDNIRQLNHSEMKICFINGSIIQFVYNLNEVMGENARGVIFSEFSQENSTILDYLRPTLIENEGWALFDWTAEEKENDTN